MELGRVAHMADHMANDPRESMNDLHCKAKAVSVSNFPHDIPWRPLLDLGGVGGPRREKSIVREQ